MPNNLQPIVEDWLGGMTRDEAVDLLNGKGVPCGPVYDAEDVARDSHVKARGMIMDIEDPDVGTFGFARSVPHLSSNAELPKNPAPKLGEDTRSILENLLGMNADDVDGLAAGGVVQTND